MTDTAGVLEADGEKTPIDDAGDVWVCTEKGCEELPPFNTKARLGAHRWHAHKIRSQGRSSRPARASKPKTSSASSGGSGSTSTSSKDLKSRLTVSLSLVSTGVAMLDSYDGEIIHKGTPALAQSLSDWADADPKARKIIEMLAFDAPWFGVCMIMLSMGFPIAAHHGFIKNIPAPFRIFAAVAPIDTTATDQRTGESAGNGNLGDVFAQAMQDPNFLSFVQGMAGGSGFAPPMAAQPPAHAGEPMGERPVRPSRPVQSVPPPPPPPEPPEPEPDEVPVGAMMTVQNAGIVFAEPGVKGGDDDYVWRSSGREAAEEVQ